MKIVELQKIIEKAWNDKKIIHTDKNVKTSIEYIIEKLDQGELRIAEPNGKEWKLNDWIRKAVLLYFGILENKKIKSGELEFYDKIKLKSHYDKLEVRAVPNAIVRYGAFINKGVVLMPSYVNIGAYIDSGSMIDIGSCVGSCAQIGKNVHLSAGAILGGVLEPIQASPVIIEDDVFIGANSVIVEGVRIGKGAVLGANVSITGSTKIFDVSNKEVKEYKSYIPPNSVVIPGTIPKKFPAGQYNVSCALIIGERKDSTNAKVALNNLLRIN
ncbi:MAG: 2,3,4,5-tetrahydropyridine-2,6-dicarboxylate N-succinyltransferase [Bacteroidetes bacterium]|nr:2,3,4,5-tetrahydropyridine-2,6-dicarboxylate N-succinyltransferase [Bacteroidota bacterium]